MPRYDYRCTACGKEFELVQSFDQAGTGACPVCSGAGQRLYHVVPVIYKGSGFYTTDYGRPKQPVENGAKADAPSKTEKPAPADGPSGAKDTKASVSEGSSEASPAKAEPSTQTASKSEA